AHHGFLAARLSFTLATIAGGTCSLSFQGATPEYRLLGLLSIRLSRRPSTPGPSSDRENSPVV
ncbi:hypothetical protein, partial [Sulfobacillus harzensis]|uniref:hypothetical protein n=1 Tax=Sulfobacillus harzensis TaxID=2729629 RepID=UPI001A9BA93B